MKRALSIVVGLVVAFVVLQVGHGVLMRLGEDPSAARRIAWTEGASRVLLGNSVTASALDPEVLDAALYTAEGSQPAHWWAAARHRVAEDAQVILYTAPQSWGGTALTNLHDELLLADILIREAPELTERVLGEATAPQALERAQARHHLRSRLVRLSWAPAEWWYGLRTDGPVVEPAMDRLHEGRPPHRTGTVLDTFQDVDAQAPSAIEPTLLDELAAEVELVVVFPADAQAGNCSREGAYPVLARELAALDVAVLDLSWAPGNFLARHHQNKRGKAAISAVLAEELPTLAPGQVRVFCP